MLQNLKDLFGYNLLATDGEIGQVKDAYFDDQSWAIRYLVADTGSWLSGRQVLLTPHALGPIDPDGRILSVKLTRQQIEASPSIDAHKPVSRQYEIEYYNYYGWPAYWNGGAMWGFGGYPVVAAPSREAMAAHLSHHREDRHLRSARAVAGYAIHATDGEIGTLSGFRFDDRNWAIGQLAVDTGHWYAGKEILISTAKVGRISYESSEVFVALSKEAIQHTADHAVVKSGA